ncbi:hypothetical protein [Paenibacillus macerans]|uniref:hypothetical protein n=1 Tax=Paenibacillus macerans TaxID=44252 RepID=UPI003D30F0D2
MKKSIIILLTVLILGLLALVLYSGYSYTTTYYKHEHIKGVVVELSDNKVGMGSTTLSIKTTDEQEIADVIRLMKNRTVFKLFPDIGPAKSYTSDYSDFRIEFISDTNLTLEYRVTSSGNVEVRKGFGNKASNTIIFGGSGKKWFNEINDVFDEKKQNNLWSSSNQE